MRKDEVESYLSTASIIRLHELIPLHPLREILLPQRRRMRPRLQAILLPNRSRKATTPLLPRKMRHHIFNRLFMHQIRVPAHIIEDRGELYQLPQCSDFPTLADILMPNYGFCDGFCLLNWGVV